MANRTDYGVCMLCEALCGLEVEHDGSRVLKVRGDERDSFSQGHICPKGVALTDLQNDPDRLRKPLRRRGDSWQEIPWDEALDEAAQRLHEVQVRHGRDAVAIYTGNPMGHSYGALLFQPMLSDTLATRNRFSASSVDALPLTLVSTLVYGNQAVVAVPDLERTEYMLMLGANPLVSNGSVMSTPDVAKRLRALRERGGKLVVIDPRRTETAAIADEYHAIRPGTDALLLAAMLHVLFEEGLTAPGRLEPMLDGWDAIPGLVAPFTPESVSPHVGIEAAEIAALAREFAAARRAVAYGRMGTCVQEFGALSCWLLTVLNVATGNLDRPGGAMFSTAAVDLPSLAQKIGQGGTFDRWRSRVSGLPEFNGELPVATFGEEMETAGEGQIRALLTHAGNPVLSLPNGPRLARGFEQLDFMVSIDIYRNETTRFADLILPPTFGFEHDQYQVVSHGVATRNTAHYGKALLDTPEGALHDWEICLGLAERIGRLRGGAEKVKGMLRGGLGRAIGPRGALRLLLRLGPHPVTLGQLEREPHGIDLGALEPRLPGILGKNGRLRIAPQELTRDLPRLARKQAETVSQGPNGLVLVSRRTLRSNNSWMHNSERLVSGKDRCTLLMSLDDAERRGLSTGQRVVVKSRVGEIEVPLEVSDEMRTGVVCLPHGWGHGVPGNGLSVAAAHPGASVNDLTDDGFFDELSGTSALSGVPVSVTAIGV